MGRFPNSKRPTPALTGRSLVTVAARPTASIPAPLTVEERWRKSVLPFTLHEEGGLSRDRKDPGNWTGGKVGKGDFVGTKYGISAAAHPGVDVVSLTVAQTSEIYWREYVVSPGFDKLPLPLMLVAFDAGVCCGQVHAELWLREAEKERGLAAQVRRFSALNLAYHRTLRKWSLYGRVWGPRISACQRQALLLAVASPVAIAPTATDITPLTARKAPQPKHQPAASGWVLFWRVVLGALFGPIPKGP